LIYYPGVGVQPGAVYYEGLFNGSSEYDHRWFVVPAQQDASLRQMLAGQGFTVYAQPWLLPLFGAALLVAGLILLIGLWRRRSARWLALATPAALRAERNR
jgi:hypothetical protein